MAGKTLKIKQKLSKTQFDELRKQIKSPPGVKIVERLGIENGATNMGTVKDAFNLGNKIEIIVCEDGAEWVTDKSQFVMVDTQYCLTRV